MTKSEIFKDKFPEFKGVVNFNTISNDQINFIDVEANRVEYTYIYVMNCGCCVDIESDVETLEFMLDDMSDGEFEELCSEVAKHV
jgi:hypothetical protein